MGQAQINVDGVVGNFMRNRQHESSTDTV